ncbi:DUF3134 domain-containing protein [Oscillatoria sp. FACHB-1406]|uniref:DUF3134 domain-containing protein n=1 Tax=Oscillatoria sp. FACHB-1406 TaxID=2692846 RepID=UPI001688A317|nr:DUF3134 domain-containing protein [Oscillatoria sp. FACHB-1406]MBD2580618.1 DUF3134 domain-containing protein [Oscillatoria sp. FACHB-1406]
MESNHSESVKDNNVDESPSVQNRALSQESRYEPATVIPLKRGASLLDWLEGNGRLLPRDKQEEPRFISEIEEDDISGLMDDDDRDYDGIDDDDDFIEVED